ncbi:hypothetical protein RR42_s0294 [Cupriavidus basilensis]|uniref:Uncharacterized protein n=1 Tax=Cupriavidus basilensis TaxID=68895 RepID=A0A0C4YGQ5_9BURK|nr:hypothetical protein RR42_s0294 [Cupriavidus basilensis]
MPPWQRSQMTLSKKDQVGKTASGSAQAQGDGTASCKWCA